MSSPLKTNTETIQNLINQINALPDASSGVELPTLTNEGSAADLLSGKELIDSDGNIVTGTMATKTSNNLIASGATVTVPAGYYASQATKSVSTATQATPSVSIDSSGLITASATQTAGYVSAGTKSVTHQLPTQPEATITPKNFAQYAVSAGKYTTGDVIVEGDSNLFASNIKSGVSIFGVTGTYEGEGGGGDTSIEDSLITRTVTNCINDRVTNIGNYAFYSCSSLTSVGFPVATTIGSNAFYFCSSLTSISFPVATTISNSAFAHCSSLTSVNFPKVTTIGSSAFYSCSSLTSVGFPVATTIGSNAFYNCSSLTSVSFSACKSIYQSAFRSCNKLSSLTLGASTVCTLSASNAFSSTPYVGYSAYFSGTPYIYVPASLIDSYKTATNWTYFSKYFSTIEISFTIDEAEYQADRGMTWGEWVESDYNTDGFTILNSFIYTKYNIVLMLGYENIKETAIIIEGEQYKSNSGSND